MQLTNDQNVDVHSQDLQSLDDFVQEWQREDGSHLQNKIKVLVSEYRSRNERNRKPNIIYVSVVLKGTRTVVMACLNSTVLSLKRRLECLAKRPISNLVVERTSQSLDGLNFKTLAECCIVDGDVLVPDYCEVSYTGILQRIDASGLVAHSGFQYLVLVLHAFMLDQGFETVIPVKNARDGHHPICKGEYSAFWYDIL